MYESWHTCVLIRFISHFWSFWSSGGLNKNAFEDFLKKIDCRGWVTPIHSSLESKFIIYVGHFFKNCWTTDEKILFCIE